MHLSLCQLPDQPGLHRPKEQLAPLRPLSGALHMVQDPFKLRPRKIGVNHQSGLLPEHVNQSLFLQLVTIPGGPAALPDNGWTHRLPGPLIPHHCSLSLIGNADGCDILCPGSRLGHGLHCHPKLGRPDLIRIMLHPARLRKILGKLLLRQTADLPFPVKKDTPVAGRPCIQGHHVFCHKLPPYSAVFVRKKPGSNAPGNLHAEEGT